MPAHLYSYAIPTTLPDLSVRRGLILEWDDGWGEIAPLPGFSCETLAEAQNEILSLLPSLGKKKATLPSVRFAIQSASLPFSPLPFSHPIARFHPSTPPCPVQKLKIGHLSVSDAIALVQTIPQTTRLRLDCNRKWTLSQALDFARFFPDSSKERFEFLEEPVFSLSDLMLFSKKTDFPIAIDESYRLDPHTSLQIPSLRALVIKPSLSDLPSSLPSHISLVLSSAYETSLGLLQIARLPSASPLGLDTFRFLREDLLIPSLKVIDGHLSWEGGRHPVDRTKLCWIASSPLH
ncbi:MAG: hypothetical protein KGI80_03330 [Verrucomicrobiota bacterium]|nr:hypothetical protein [Verrucomicrobiota bacterium]